MALEKNANGNLTTALMLWADISISQETEITGSPSDREATHGECCLLSCELLVMDFRSQEITRSKWRALVEGTLRSLMLPIRVFRCTSCYVSMELITSMSLVSAHPGSYSILRHLKSIFVVWIFYRKYAWKWWVYLQKYFLINDKNAKIQTTIIIDFHFKG